MTTNEAWRFLNGKILKSVARIAFADPQKVSPGERLAALKLLSERLDAEAKREAAEAPKQAGLVIVPAKSGDWRDLLSQDQ